MKKMLSLHVSLTLRFGLSLLPFIFILFNLFLETERIDRWWIQKGTTCDKFVAATRQQRVDLRGWDQKEGYLPAVFEDDAAASRTHFESWMTKMEFVSLPEDTLGQRRDLLWFSQCA